MTVRSEKAYFGLQREAVGRQPEETSADYDNDDTVTIFFIIIISLLRTCTISSSCTEYVVGENV